MKMVLAKSNARHLELARCLAFFCSTDTKIPIPILVSRIRNLRLSLSDFSRLA